MNKQCDEYEAMRDKSYGIEVPRPLTTGQKDVLGLDGLLYDPPIRESYSSHSSTIGQLLAPRG